MKVKVNALVAAVGALALCGRADLVKLEHGGDSCVVETHGGLVVSYRARGEELLWMPSAAAKYSAQWRHGGIPIAWPWFGRLGEGDSQIHGYAWKSDFRIASRTKNSVILVLDTESATLEYTVRIGDSLLLELRTVSKSRFDQPLGVAFHPYFRVGERDESVVEGIDDVPVPVTNAVDRSVRFGRQVARHECVIRDGARQRSLRIVAEYATGVNLWNPGREKDCPGFIPADEWRRFVAVEPVSMGFNRFHVLAPGQENALKMSVSLVP